MTSLRLYNTLTKTKEDFVPIDPNNVRMYVCGPTVYDYAHIGNARPVIVFDVLFRLLRHLYGADHVTYVRNITDVDDKINARAAERGISIRDLTDETYAQYKSDVTALGCLPPSEEPRATDYIEVMQEIIEKLRENQHAYVENDHVLFSVSSMPDYGELSKRPLDEMIAGARVDIAPYKRNPMDFVLWKPSDNRSNISLPGWKSPKGIEPLGRPGWHLECSAMAWAKLGQVFDIHGGGIDLVFPHHENEIAQSRCAFHTGFMAKYWMHNGFLEVEGAKMSKSLGNFVTINELLNTRAFGGRSWAGNVLRFAMLKTHYRQPVDWTLRSLQEANDELSAWANAISNSGHVGQLIGRAGVGLLANPPSEIVEALADDLNTPNMLTAMRELFTRYTQGSAQAAVDLAEACDFLGLLNLEKLFVYNPYHVGSGPKLLPPQFKTELREVQVAYANSNPDRVSFLIGELLRDGVSVTVRNNGALVYEVIGSTKAVDKDTVERRIEARNAARKAKDFKESDRIRDELLAQGIVLKDGPTGTTWEVKR